MRKEEIERLKRRRRRRRRRIYGLRSERELMWVWRGGGN